MPTLNWIGKDKVINHHLDVPFRVLEHKYGFTPNGKQETPINKGNLILHGDNLEVLKTLLPQYEGKIKCIYIDPPYNTGNENWVYNDNVNDSKIKKWLHQVVGKEGEDLSRHDKWLCMMYPRLVLLQKLLSVDGVIFVSIDDNEQANLKLMMDEIFGQFNFIVNIIWQKRYSRENRGIIGDAHEFIAVYSRNYSAFKLIANRIEPTDNQIKIYKNPNKDPKGRWRAIPMTAQGYRPNQMYPITAPEGTVHLPPEGRCWSMIEPEFQKLLKANRIYFGKDNNSQPNVIRYLSEIEGFVPWSWWPSDEVGHTDEAKKEIHSFFGKLEAFDTPKPVRLINRVIQIGTNKNDIILDSFAGSGTTAHAVLNLNKLDGGNRKFILVEMEEYAESITAERVKKVIQGYSDVEGTGGSFDYYELGLPLFNESNTLNDQVPLNRIREYIWYSETRVAFIDPDNKTSNNPYFLGIKDETGYYFYFETQQITTLDYDFLSTIDVKSGQYVVYADNCLLSKTFMEKSNIIFKKIPRDISRL